MMNREELVHKYLLERGETSFGDLCVAMQQKRKNRFSKGYLSQILKDKKLFKKSRTERITIEAMNDFGDRILKDIYVTYYIARRGTQ